MTRTRTNLAALVRLDRQLRALGVRGPGTIRGQGMAPIACQAVRVATVPTGEHGCLVFAGDHLVAVLVRVGSCHAADGYDAPENEALDMEPEPEGWHLESGYGACRVGASPLFGTLNEGLAWIARRVSASP